jgi:hypothetical protein
LAATLFDELDVVRLALVVGARAPADLHAHGALGAATAMVVVGGAVLTALVQGQAGLPACISNSSSASRARLPALWLVHPRSSVGLFHWLRPLAGLGT